MGRAYHRWSQEERAFLNQHRNLLRRELTRLFNARFGTAIPVATLKNYCGKHGFVTGRGGVFRPGNVPWNTGVKGVNGWSDTRFQKGNRPRNWLPVGSDRVAKDGYLEIKIAEPRVWQSLHVLVWESHNGPLPPGCVVIFGDGDRRNVDPANLVMVTRRQLLWINRHRLAGHASDLTRAAVLTAALVNLVEDKDPQRSDKQKPCRKKAVSAF
jgi:hypothetical protein